MKILFNDILQYSDVPEELKSPALSEIYNITTPIMITLNKESPVNSIGIGNASKDSDFYITFNDAEATQLYVKFTDNGLYCLEKTVIASQITIQTTSAYAGRIAAGFACDIPTSISKEPGFNSTAQPRTTLSGQVVRGLGGYNFRTVSLDSRYKIGSNIMSEIQKGYKYIGMGYPFFIDLSTESYKLPFEKLYAAESDQHRMSFESGVKKFLYSRRWNFEERF